MSSLPVIYKMRFDLDFSPDDQEMLHRIEGLCPPRSPLSEQIRRLLFFCAERSLQPEQLQEAYIRLQEQEHLMQRFTDFLNSQAVAQITASHTIIPKSTAAESDADAPAVKIQPEPAVKPNHVAVQTADQDGIGTEPKTAVQIQSSGAAELSIQNKGRSQVKASAETAQPDAADDDLENVFAAAVNKAAQHLEQHGLDQTQGIEEMRRQALQSAEQPAGGEAPLVTGETAPDLQTGGIINNPLGEMAGKAAPKLTEQEIMEGYKQQYSLQINATDQPPQTDQKLSAAFSAAQHNDDMTEQNDELPVPPAVPETKTAAAELKSEPEGAQAPAGKRLDDGADPGSKEIELSADELAELALDDGLEAEDPAHAKSRKKKGKRGFSLFSFLKRKKAKKQEALLTE